jgi:hypothetical protein
MHIVFGCFPNDTMQMYDGATRDARWLWIIVVEGWKFNAIFMKGEFDAVVVVGRVDSLPSKLEDVALIGTQITDGEEAAERLVQVQFRSPTESICKRLQIILPSGYSKLVSEKISKLAPDWRVPTVDGRCSGTEARPKKQH